MSRLRFRPLQVYTVLICALVSQAAVSATSWDYPRVLSIRQTSVGTMWFARGGEISHLDAVFFSPMTGPEGEADDLCCFVLEASDGSLWFGANQIGPEYPGGVLRYDGSRWEHLTSPEGPGFVLAAVEAADGSLWFGGFEGASRLDGDVWEHHDIPGRTALNFVTSVTMAPDGSLWFGTREGVQRFDGLTWESFTVDDGLVDNFVQAVHASSDGSIWIGTWRGLSKYTDGDWRTFTTANGLASNDVRTIYETPDGVLWFGTSSGATSLHEGEWETTLAGERILSIYQSGDGSMWFGTEERLTRVPASPEGFSRFPTIEFLVNQVNALLEDSDGRILVGTSRLGTNENENGWVALPGIVALYRSSDGALWTGSGSGVRRSGAGRSTRFDVDDGLAQDSVTVITESRDGAMWFGTGGGGVSRFQDGEWTTFSRDEGLVHNDIRAILQHSDGAMWFGTPAGVSRYDGVEWQTLTTRDGLADENVFALAEGADGSMWVATWGGLSRYDGSAWTLEYGGTVYGITATTDGDIWFVAPVGLFRWDGARFQSWDRDAMPPFFVVSNRAPVMEASDGAIWFGARDAVYRFLRSEFRHAEAFITVSPEDGVLSSSRFLFEYSGIDISSSQAPLISVAVMPGTQMPTDSDWSPFSADREYEVSGLDNGIYTFYARAMDQFGNVELIPASSTFSVDLVGPTVAILSPQGVIEGVVEIIGSAFDSSVDPNIESFRLEYGRGRFESEVKSDGWETDRLSEVATEPVINGRLGVWDTNGLSGFYVLRLTAQDSFNRRSSYVATVNIVPAVADIDSRIGGHVRSSDGTVDLYVPPDALDDDDRLLHDGAYIVVVETSTKSASKVVTVVNGR